MPCINLARPISPLPPHTYHCSLLGRHLQGEDQTGRWGGEVDASTDEAAMYCWVDDKSGNQSSVSGSIHDD
uniref:Uncharacterized protein n=1 Tax=Triticum urartu TaxID=4572 RepID=A0A8R7Q2T0_TRIUA